MQELIFITTLMFVAFLYSSVGHGGASGYLALMALFGIETIYMKSTALTLNLFVSAISFWAFFKKGHFKFKVLLPFIIGSMPMAFIGARINIDPQIYKIILAVFLIIAVTRMLIAKKGDFKETKELKFIPAILIGAVLGLFSGMIGIGGGIILSPLLLLFRWANVKETAGISAVFIFLNSSTGLLGLHLSSHYIPNPHVWIWAMAGLVGGFLGGYIGSGKLDSYKLKYVLAFVLFIASVKLIFV